MCHEGDYISIEPTEIDVFNEMVWSRCVKKVKFSFNNVSLTEVISGDCVCSVVIHIRGRVTQVIKRGRQHKI